MKYVLNLSLEHMTLVEIAFTLWNQDDIRALIEKFQFEEAIPTRKKKWQKINEKVVEKVSHLNLPMPLKEKQLAFIKPIGKRIRQLLECYKENGYFSINLLDKISWTSQGAINKKKITEMLIKDESIDVTTRYKLACIYCLEDDILELWDKIPQDSRKSFYSKHDLTPEYTETFTDSEDMRSNLVRKHELVFYWTYYMNGEGVRLDNRIQRKMDRMCSPYQYALESAACYGKKDAVEYFLRKLTDVERYESLVNISKCVAERYTFLSTSNDYADLLCFLISQMDEQQQLKIFKSHPYNVLRALLKWPWERFFLETAIHICDFLDFQCYIWMLARIIKKVKNGHKDYNYQKIFGEFWQKSPKVKKKYVIEECNYLAYLLGKLLDIKDEENIKLVFKDLTLLDKRRFIDKDSGKYLWRYLITRDEWDFITLIIQECAPSKDEVVQFKMKFKENITWLCIEDELELNSEKWKKFFCLLDQFIYEYDERTISEESDNNPVL